MTDTHRLHRVGEPVLRRGPRQRLGGQTMAGQTRVKQVGTQGPCHFLDQRQRMERARQRAIADFSALLRQGYLSAQSMVESLPSASLPVDDRHLAASHAPDDPTRVPAPAALAA